MNGALTPGGRITLIVRAFISSQELPSIEAVRKQYRYETGQDVSEAEVLRHLPKQEVER